MRVAFANTLRYDMRWKFGGKDEALKRCFGQTMWSKWVNKSFRESCHTEGSCALRMLSFMWFLTTLTVNDFNFCKQNMAPGTIFTSTLA